MHARIHNSSKRAWSIREHNIITDRYRYKDALLGACGKAVRETNKIHGGDEARKSGKMLRRGLIHWMRGLSLEIGTSALLPTVIKEEARTNRG